MSHLRLQNKFRLATVLCLSVICVVLSIARLAAGMRRNVFGKLQFEMAWLSFMLHCEASVAVMAGSIPALRAVYTAYRDQKLDTHPEKIPENVKVKALRVLGSMRRKEEPILPSYTKVHARASIARWRQSIIGIIPMRPQTYTGGDINIIDLNHQRQSTAESVMIDPTLAYHNIRKQELKTIGTLSNKDLVVWKEALRLKCASIDLSEVSSHERVNASCWMLT